MKDEDDRRLEDEMKMLGSLAKQQAESIQDTRSFLRRRTSHWKEKLMKVNSLLEKEGDPIMFRVLSIQRDCCCSMVIMYDHFLKKLNKKFPLE